MGWTAEDPISIRIEDVPRASVTDALIAIEMADERGIFDAEQHRRLTKLVLGLREALEIPKFIPIPPAVPDGDDYHLKTGGA